MNNPNGPKKDSPFAARVSTRPPMPMAGGASRPVAPVVEKPAAAPAPTRKGGGGIVIGVAAVAMAAGAAWWFLGRDDAAKTVTPEVATPVSAAEESTVTKPAETAAGKIARLAKEFETIQVRSAGLELSDAERAVLAGATLQATQGQARSAAGDLDGAMAALEQALSAAGPVVVARLQARAEAEAMALSDVNLDDYAADPARALAKARREATEAVAAGRWAEAATRTEEGRALAGPARTAVAVQLAEAATGAAARGDVALATLFHERALRLDGTLGKSRDHLFRNKFQAGQTLRTPGGMVLAYAPPVEFVRGSASGEAGRDADETPTRVVLTKGIFIGVNEVTQADWDRVFGPGAAVRTLRAAKAKSEAMGPELPMHSVTWQQAADFCAKLSELEGMAFRLPTEAEWEYACRAGTTTAFNLGVDGLSARDANIDDGSNDAVFGPRPVGSSGRANAWGLHDMHGNVWEWCADWSAPYGAAGTTVRDPAGPPVESVGRIDLALKVVRGGGWNAPASDARSANRWAYTPAVATGYIGLRVAHDPDLTRP